MATHASKIFPILLTLLLAANLFSVNASDAPGNEGTVEKENIYKRLLGITDFKHTLYYMTGGCFVLMVILLQLNFVMCNPITQYCTESFVLVTFGILAGLVIEQAHNKLDLFNVTFFNLALLPFIMMDAGWFFPNRAVFKNSIPVFCFAIIGTIFNAAALSGVVYGVTQFSHREMYADFTYTRALMFSVILSAVDPVAVLAVFESIHVNDQLYGIVFGESLFNDGVAIVAYTILATIAPDSKPVKYEVNDIVLASLVKFFLSSFCGVLIGVIFAAIIGLLTKYTYHMTFIEPIVVIAFLYISYIITESIHYSAIFAIITSAILAKPCVSENISKPSRTALQYIIKLLGHTSEGAIFILIGITNVHKFKYERIDFAMIGIVYLATLIVRFIGVFGLSALMNLICLSGPNRISAKNQLIMGYGGLRGAIALALSLKMTNDNFIGETELADSLNITVLILVILTVVLQGSTVSFIINCFKVHKAEKDKSPLFSSINGPVMDEILKLAGLVAHHSSESYMIAFVKKIYERYLRKFFVSNEVTRTQWKILNEMNKYADAPIGQGEVHNMSKRLTVAFAANKGELPLNFRKNEMQNDELDNALKTLDEEHQNQLIRRATLRPSHHSKIDVSFGEDDEDIKQEFQDDNDD